jgi:small-conductance mechanosensitive channel
MKDKLSINKKYLILIAGLVWVCAGSMVIRIGLPLFLRLAPENLWLIPLGIIVFLVFYFLIFSKLVKKHVSRIKNNPSEKMPFWYFFDLTSYIIMLVMMSGGILLRVEHLIPIVVIAFFYSGLGFGLFCCGTRFLNAFFSKEVLQ